MQKLRGHKEETKTLQSTIRLGVNEWFYAMFQYQVKVKDSELERSIRS